jgi:hypothetical protein
VYLRNCTELWLQILARRLRYGYCPSALISAAFFVAKADILGILQLTLQSLGSYFFPCAIESMCAWVTA